MRGIDYITSGCSLVYEYAQSVRRAFAIYCFASIRVGIVFRYEIYSLSLAREKYRFIGQALQQIVIAFRDLIFHSR